MRSAPAGEVHLYSRLSDKANTVGCGYGYAWKMGSMLEELPSICLFLFALLLNGSTAPQSLTTPQLTPDI